MKKRVLSLLLAVLLFCSLAAVSPAALAGWTDAFKNSGTYLRTSYDEEDYVEMSISGSTLTVSGRLRLDDLTGVMVGLGDDSKWLEGIYPGMEFSATFSLSGVTGPTEIKVYTKQRQNASYWGMVWSKFYVDRRGDGYVILSSPVLGNNNAFSAAWVNPADYLGQVPDAVKAKSDEIVGSETDEYEKLFLLYKWVAENIYYDWDKYTGVSSTTSYDSAGVLKDRKSVCAGYASLLVDLVRAQGIPCMEVTTYALGVSTKGGTYAINTEYVNTTSTNHEHAEAWVDGRWVIMDPTWDSNNKYENGTYQEKAPTGWYYFDITPEAFAHDHKVLTRGDRAVTLASDGALRNRNTVENGKRPSDWALDEAARALSAGLIPYALQKDYQSAISREDFCHLVMRLLEVRAGVDTTEELLAAYGLEPQDGLFTDTTDPDVYAANLLGIVNGTNTALKLFSPEQSITRQEAAAMLARAAARLEVASQGEPIQFSDAAQFASWAADGIATVSSLVSADGRTVMGGSAGRFDPKGDYTVEQSVLTMYRLFRCGSVD